LGDLLPVLQNDFSLAVNFELIDLMGNFAECVEVSLLPLLKLCDELVWLVRSFDLVLLGLEVLDDCIVDHFATLSRFRLRLLYVAFVVRVPCPAA